MEERRESTTHFGATREPEYVTLPPDGRSSDPKPRGDHRPMLGATTQDDPTPAGFDTYPDQGGEGEITFVAVFEDITGARSCSDNLARRGPGIETALVSRRGDGPEQGLRPGNVITGPGYGASAHDEAAPPADENQLGNGVAVGATIGATAGLLAATYVIPPFGTLVATGALVATLAGAGLGSFLGGTFEYLLGDQGDDASIYPGTVRKGGVILLARTGRQNADEVRRLIEFWHPLEIRVQ